MRNPPADENVTYTATLNPQHWRAEGKIALRYPECHHNRGCEDKGVNANMAWTHHNQDELLVITDPFGQERMRIDYRGGVINVREGAREEVMSKKSWRKKSACRYRSNPSPTGSSPSAVTKASTPTAGKWTCAIGKGRTTAASA